MTRQLSLPVVLIVLTGCMPTENQMPEGAFIVPSADKPVLNNIDVSPPPPFELGFEADDLKLGEFAGFHASGADAGENVVFLRGYGIGTDCPSGFAPLCTDILGPQLMFPGSTEVANGDGDASIYARLPSDLDLVGARMYMQAIVYNDGGPFRFSDVVTGTFSVGEACMDDVFEPNDELLAATNLGEGSWEGLTMCGEGTDWYKIDLRDGDTMDIDLSFIDAEGDIDMAVYVEDGSYVGGSFSVTDYESISLIALEDATAYVNVYMYADDGVEQVGNTYDLTMTIDEGSSVDCEDDALEPNDTPSDAMDITSMLSGDCATDEFADLTACVDTTGLDVYAVTLANGESVEAQVISDALEGQIDLQILSSTTVVLDQDADSDGDQYVSYVNTTGFAQTVYLRVDLEADLGAYVWGGTPYTMYVTSGADCTTDSDPRVGLSLQATALASLLLPGDVFGVPGMNITVTDTTDSGTGACVYPGDGTSLDCVTDAEGYVNYQLEPGAYYEMQATGFGFVDTYLPLSMPGVDVESPLPMADVLTLGVLFDAYSIDFDETKGLIGALVYDFDTGALLADATITPFMADSCSDPSDPSTCTETALDLLSDALAWTSTPVADTDGDGVLDSGAFFRQNTTYADGLIAFANVTPGTLVFDISTPDADFDGEDDYTCTPAFVPGAYAPVNVYENSLTGLQILCSRNDFGIGAAMVCGDEDDYLEDNDSPSTAYDLNPWVDSDCSTATFEGLYSCTEEPANLDVYRITLAPGDYVRADMTIDPDEGEADITLEYQLEPGLNYQMDADFGSGADSTVDGYNDTDADLEVYIRVELTDDLGGEILGGTSYSMSVTRGPVTECDTDVDPRIEHAFEVDDLASTLGGVDAWVPIPGLLTSMLVGGAESTCSPEAIPGSGVCVTMDPDGVVSYMLEPDTFHEIMVTPSDELDFLGGIDSMLDYRPLYIPISTGFGDLDGWYYVMASEGLIDLLEYTYLTPLGIAEPVDPATGEAMTAVMHVRVFDNDVSGEGYPVYGPSPDGITGVKITPYMADSCSDPADVSTCTEVAAGFAGAYEASLGGFLPYYYDATYGVWADMLGPTDAPQIVVTSGDAIMAFALMAPGEIVFDIDSDFDGDGANDYECVVAHNPTIDTPVTAYAGGLTSVGIRCSSCDWASPCPVD